MFTQSDIRWLLIFFGWLLFVVITWDRPKRRRMSRAEMIKLIEKILDEK
jgi:hypothetical protein